jgi:membrane protein required for colicin V production
MNAIDVAILIIIALSALIGVARGFVREALALGGWVVAVWVALEFSPGLSELMKEIISIDSLRFVTAFLVLFLSTLVLAAVLNHLISHTVKKSALKGTDRALGVLFGLVRGVVLVAVLAWVAGFTKLPQMPPWTDALLAGHFTTMSGWMRAMLPPDLGKRLGYEQK